MSSTLSAWGIRVKIQSEKMVASATGTGTGTGTNSSGGGTTTRGNGSGVVSVLDREDAVDYYGDEHDHPFRPTPTKPSSSSTTTATASAAAATAALSGLWGFSSPYSSSTKTTPSTKTTAPSSSKNGHQPEPQSQSHSSKKCDMYLQSNVGACFCVSKSNDDDDGNDDHNHRQHRHHHHNQVVTTSSLLLIRKSPTTPCPTTTNKGRSWSFQWYYSSDHTTRRKRRRNSTRRPSSSSSSSSSSVVLPALLNNSVGINKKEDEDDNGNVSTSSSSDNNATTTSTTAEIETETVDNIANNDEGIPCDDDRDDIDDNNDETEETWTILPGATHAAFQPNTTLIGRRLRCVVKIPLLNDDSSSSTTKRDKLQPLSSTTDDEDDSNEDDDSSSSSSSFRDDDAGGDASNGDNNGNNINNRDSSNDDDKRPNNQGGEKNDDGKIRVVVCDLKDPVVADMTMFNSARQMMYKRGGAKFGSLLGRSGSHAAGETFMVEICATVPTTDSALASASASSVLRNSKNSNPNKPPTVNSVRILRKDGDGDGDGKYIPVIDRAIVNVSARADPAHGRHVDLIFPSLRPHTYSTTLGGESECVEEKELLKFCNTTFHDGDIDSPRNSKNSAPRLELETSNRMTRESLLLALGIANFLGDESSLNIKTVLYQDDPLPSRSNTEITKTLDGTSSGEEKKEDDSIIAEPGPVPRHEHGLEPKEEDAVDDTTVVDNISSPSTSSESCKSTSNAIDSAAVEDMRPSSGDATESLPRLDPHIVEKMKLMEEELEMLRSKVLRKDDEMANLLHDFQKSEASHQETKKSLESCERELRQAQQDCERIQQSKRQVERAMQSSEETMKKIEANHMAQVQNLEAEKKEQVDKTIDLEKTIRILQNEKAILGAAVEARESKLLQMNELKISNDQLTDQIAQQDELHKKIEASDQRYKDLQKELEAKSEIELDVRKQLLEALAQVEQLKTKAKKEQEKYTSCYSQFEGLQKKNQQLKGERNNFKQKNESLSKEIARICRDGRTIQDVEKMVADHDSMRHEVNVLKGQKRKALEDAQFYRKLYEQVKAAEQLHGTEEDTRRALQRTAELERLLSEMTDYVHAKEMQLDTLKQVNEALQEEIKNLAKASFQKNDI